MESKTELRYIKIVELEHLLKAYSIRNGRKRGETILKLLYAFDQDTDYISNELLVQRAKKGGRTNSNMLYSDFVYFFD